MAFTANDIDIHIRWCEKRKLWWIGNRSIVQGWIEIFTSKSLNRCITETVKANVPFIVWRSKNENN
jgi:hypothetical protein